MKKRKNYLLIAAAIVLISSCGKNSATPGTGISGSQTGFVIQGDYLYTINDNSIKVASISDPSKLEEIAKIEAGRGIETIMEWNNYLLLGTQTGMQIYSLEDPTTPKFISRYDHIESCDPVAATDSFAYVTLYNTSACNGFVNELHIINWSSITAPAVQEILQMHNPSGLALDQSKKALFVCENDSGIKVFAIGDGGALTFINNIDSVNAFDAIAYKNLLMVSTESGFEQYDYTDLENIQKRGNINF